MFLDFPVRRAPDMEYRTYLHAFRLEVGLDIWTGEPLKGRDLRWWKKAIIDWRREKRLTHPRTRDKILRGYKEQGAPKIPTTKEVNK